MHLDFVAIATTILCGPLAAQRIDVSIPATRDVTLYQDSTGQLSNDAGPSLFIGNNAFGEARRSLLAFDITGQIPVNAHIVFVQLQLTVSLAPSGATPIDVTVHRALNSWPEGNTVAIGPGGQGTQANPGDVTWLHRSYPTSFWTTPGGDFAAVPSGAASMPSSGVFALGSTRGMVEDVQHWLNGTRPNHGWLLKTDELVAQTARRLHSRQTTFVGVDPQLQIGFVPVGGSWSRGTGCRGSNGLLLRQTLVGAPLRNTVVSLRVTNGLPTLPAVTLLSITLGQTPVDLVPGCPYELGDLWFDNLMPMILDAQGSATQSFLLPNDPSIVGGPLSMQTVALDLAVPYAVTTSNGTVVVFG